MTHVNYDPATGALIGAGQETPYKIPVTQEVYNTWFHYQATADRKGVEPKTPNQAEIATLRAAVTRQVDSDVDDIYGAVLGNREPEYTLAEAEARAFAADNYETDPVPMSVASWAAAKVADNWTARQAADDILATAAAWRAGQSQIRLVRLSTKERARHAASVSELELILGEWTMFVAMARQELGV